MVPGVTMSRIAARRSTGSVPASSASHHDTGDDQEDQLQAHKPKIIPPPAEPRPSQPTLAA
jgi:hypothetical protein